MAASTPFCIEPWTPDRADGAIDVIHTVFDEYSFTWDEEGYHADLYDVPRHYLEPGHRFFLAVREGVVLGTVALERFDPLPGRIGDTLEVRGEVRVAGADCSLNRLYVHPSGRRLGIGRALVEKVLAEARASGCSAMEIWSDKRFTDAHRLYERLGAKVVGDRICDDPDVSPEWGLILTLS